MKLRLLITPKCNRNCERCCNKNFDLMSLPEIQQADEFKEFTEISLTGGEPLLEYDKLRETLMYILEYGDFKGPIHLYTAMPDHPKMSELIYKRCNLTITIHDKKALVDVLELYRNNPVGLKIFNPNTSGVRIKLAPAVHRYYNLITSIVKDKYWKVEKFDWIENCPLPKGEVFKRI